MQGMIAILYLCHEELHTSSQQPKPSCSALDLYQAYDVLHLAWDLVD